MPWTPTGPERSGSAPPGRWAALAPWVSATLVAMLMGVACSSAPPQPEAGTAAASPETAVRPNAPARPAPKATSTTAPAYPVATVALAEVPTVTVFDGPGGSAVRTLPNPFPPYDAELAFLVVEERREWVKVMLPVRPNGTTGWVRARDVLLTEHPYRIVVDLGAHRLVAYKGNDTVVDEPIAIGTARTPTPVGHFYTLWTFLVGPGQPYYGPYALGLSGFSEVLFDFAGGDGQFGIHGTNEPSSIGRSVSNGCIRISNAAITELARLPVGVPVEIRS